jgi:hypothetical protein
MKNSCNIDLDTIQFVYAKPYIEHYFLYGVNSVKNLTIIPKDQLRDLISDKLKCIDLENMDIVFSRNLPFLYNNTTKKIRMFRFVNECPSKEEVEQNLFIEMKTKSSPKMQSPLRRTYENIFTKGSLLRKR